jgi:hypothetical protein
MRVLPGTIARSLLSNAIDETDPDPKNAVDLLDALAGRWDGFRFLLGPWRWLLLIYVYMEEEGRVVVVTIQDARV